jgi:hypothetical protein
MDGHLSEGREWLAEALGVEGAVDGRWRSKGLWGAAWLAYHQGDYGAADHYGREMLQMARSDDAVAMRNALTIGGIVDLANGRFSNAIHAFDRCVELLGEREPDWLLATSLLNLGMAAVHGRDPRARTVLGEARELYVELGDQHFAARAGLYSGYAALLSGDEGVASDRFCESLITFWELDDLWGATEAIEGLAATAGAARLSERAATIAGAAETLRGKINARQFDADRAVMERHLAIAKASVSDQAWQVMLETGRAMSVEEMLDYVLDQR